MHLPYIVHFCSYSAGWVEMRRAESTKKGQPPDGGCPGIFA
jgi:hypothetical protein